MRALLEVPIRATNLIICVSNEGYELDLELGQVYERVPDESLEADDLRVIDETGEDYIYPANYFLTSDDEILEIETYP